MAVSILTVYSLSSRFEQEELVKAGKERSGMLVDGTQDGLAGSSEFTEERDNEVGALAVQTGRGFIEEQQGTEC